MSTIYRQKPPSALNEVQMQAKLLKDSEYEIAAQNLSADFYLKKKSIGVTAHDEKIYKERKAKLWDDYFEWATNFGLYEEVSLDQQLVEAEGDLNILIERVNAIRLEMGNPLINIKEGL